MSFADALSSETVVAAACALLEAQPGEEAAQVLKIDVSVGLSLKNPLPKLGVFVHTR